MSGQIARVVEVRITEYVTDQPAPAAVLPPAKRLYDPERDSPLAGGPLRYEGAPVEQPRRWRWRR